MSDNIFMFFIEGAPSCGSTFFCIFRGIISQNDFFPYAPGQHFVARFCISKTPNGMKAIGIFAPFFAVEQRVFKPTSQKEQFADAGNFCHCSF
ncbi:hypothetical protein J3D43_002583 [Paenibacillus xylanexedens]|uniref:hypothetical protein n=1 Tax=Paenibacillus xylanexedens TaxID=528191 RepID=UPI00209FCE5B|nr:hypothetical protein [Paenibacillus xylanexedens]MCP1424067.1 hypothetical protein [Paenibacillus xylanexedens]